MVSIRKIGTQLALVGLTILCALGVGYAIAALTGNRSPQISPGAELVVPPAETAVAEASPAGTVVPESSVAAASTPALAEPSGRPASAAASAAAQGDEFINETFDQTSSSFPPRQDSTWSAAYVDGQYQLTLNGQTNISLVGDLPATNYRLAVDVRVNEGGAGVVFLGTPEQQGSPGTSYRLVIAPDGAYSIERQEATSVQTIVEWTPNEALTATPGALNQLRVERRGNAVEFFANDQPLTTFEVPAGEFTNRYGFVLTSRTGEGQAAFDNLRGETLP